MTSRPPPSSGTMPKITLAFGLCLLVAAGAYLFTRAPALDNSVLGLRGFATVAEQRKDLKIRFLDSNQRFNKDDYGLRILPLYAPRLSPPLNTAKPESDKNEVLRRLRSVVFNSKTSSVNTLVVLPKWREGALIREVLHPDLLIDTKSFQFSFLELNKPGSAELRRGEMKLDKLSTRVSRGSDVQFENLPKTVSLYAAQTLSKGARKLPLCKPVIEVDGMVLLAQCSRRRPFWLLTDPDIINNMGAGKGENYAFALSIVKELSKGRPILVDGTTRVLTTRVRATKERDRSFSDLARFFAYPFSLVWGGFMVLAFFGLWHAWRRVGPVEDREEADAMVASKVSAIEANISILRGHGGRSSRDGPLTATYVEQRLQQLAQDVLGTGGRGTVDGLFDALSRRNEALSQRLRDVVSDLKSPQSATPTTPSSPQTRFAALGLFETTLEEARHEFGCIANTR